jgi:hypothetical protein
MAHKSRTSHWRNGTLFIEELLFSSLEEAMTHARKHKGHKKIYDDFDILVYSGDPTEEITCESYA